jgi:chemotaxis protein CheY-P-specific phosphatase CheC
VLNGVKILFFDMNNNMVKAWKQEFAKHLSTQVHQKISIKQSKIENLSGEDMHFDCVVSPANSYGRMDGR